MVLTGTARDLVTRADATTVVAGTARISANVGIDRRLVALSTDPVEAGSAMLIGHLVGSGFRRALATSLPSHANRGTLLHLLLDDLPVAVLVSGRSLLQTALADGVAEPRPPLPRPDICAGWRTGGSAMLALSGGTATRAIGPAAAAVQVPGDALSWHRMEPLMTGEMRRCRRIDVTSGDVLHIDAAFRDTYVDAGGVERVLHEYSVIVDAVPSTLEIRFIEATPHTLPYSECVDAAVTATVARGAQLPLLRNRVEQSLFGPASCTHLNDLLRSLADAGELATLLASTR